MTVDLTIEEGNALIARFMGLKALDWKSSLDNSDMKIWIDEKSEETVFMDAALEYFSSWSRLMPVVEKIESLDFRAQIYDCYCDIYAPDKIQRDAYCELRSSSGDGAKNKLEATWLAVIQFIQWYNKNK